MKFVRPPILSDKIFRASPHQASMAICTVAAADRHPDSVPKPELTGGLPRVRRDKRDHENHYRRFYIGVGHHRFSRSIRKPS